MAMMDDGREALARLMVHPPPGTGAWSLPLTPTRTDERHVRTATAMPHHNKGDTRTPNTPDDARRHRHPQRWPIGCSIPMMMVTATRTRQGRPTTTMTDDQQGGGLRTDNARTRMTNDRLLLLGCPCQHLHEGHLALVTP